MAGTDTNSYTSDRSVRQFPNSYGAGSSNGQLGQDIYSAPDLSSFNNRTWQALLQNAGINTNNPYGTGGQWASEQEAPMYWMMRARQALAPSQYGQANDPNAVGSYFGGGSVLNGTGGGNGYDFLAGPNAGGGSLSGLLNANTVNGFSSALNGGSVQAMNDPLNKLLLEFNSNPSEMASALGQMDTAGMAGPGAQAMQSFIQNIVNRTLNNPQAMQGSNPVAAVSRALGLTQ